MRKVFAIANCRVSSDEQLLNNSLDRQKASVLRASLELDAEIIHWWSGSVSSKAGTNMNRKDLNEMMEMCKKNKSIKYAIFDELDRFMRSMFEAAHFILEFKKLGVEVVFASQPNLKTETAADKLMLVLEAFKAEGSNEERQRKSIAGQTTALNEGRYPFAPKPGYMGGPQRGIPIVHPERGPALQLILKKLAANLVTPTQALIELNKSEFTKNNAQYKMDKFSKIAIDPFYAGIVEIKKQVNVRNENGLHEPLITIEEHEQIRSIMIKRPKYQTGPRKNGNPDFPLSNFFAHEQCVELKNHGRAVGLDLNNGKNKSRIYKKYRCRTCNKSWPLSEMHEQITKVFDSYRLDEKVRKAIPSALEIVWEKNQTQINQDIARIEGSVRALRDEVKKQVINATNPANGFIKEDLFMLIEENKNQIKLLEERLEKLANKQYEDQKEFMKFALNFIENTSNHFLQEYVSRENRLRCKQLVFPSGFLLNQKNKVYTPEVSMFYRLAEKKKDTEVSDITHVVRVRGL